MVLELHLDLVSQPCRSVYIFAKKNNIQFEYKKLSLVTEHLVGIVTVLDSNAWSTSNEASDIFYTESVAILQYLVEKFGTPDHWYPADIQKRARVNEYLSWHQSATRPHAYRMFWLKLVIPKVMGIEVPKDTMDAALEDLDNTLKLIEEKFLQDRAFIAGEEISLADLVAIVEIMQEFGTWPLLVLKKITLPWSLKLKQRMRSYANEPVGAGLDAFDGRPKLSAWRDQVWAAIGAKLFDEAHQQILSTEELARTMDGNKLQPSKPKIIKMFL